MLTSYRGVNITRIEAINYNPSKNAEKQSGRFWVVGEKNVMSITYSKPDPSFLHIFYADDEFVTVPAANYNVFAHPDKNDIELMTSFNRQKNEGLPSPIQTDSPNEP